MKIQIALLCACVVVASADFIYQDGFPTYLYQQHESQFPSVNSIDYGMPFLRDGAIGRRYKRGIYDFQMNRLRSSINDNGLSQWHRNGFNSYGAGDTRYDKLRKLAATITQYW